MLDRVDRMLIAVRSRNLAAATFASMLGAQPDRDSRSACLNAHRLVMRVGESELELCEPAGPGPVQEFLDRWGEGLLAAGYASSRFDALAAHLDELGVPLAREDGRLHLPGTSTYGFPMVISPLVERPRIGPVSFFYEATNTLEGWDADLGGTELLKPLQQIFNAGQGTLARQVMLLTDGYIANGSEPWLIPAIEDLPDLQVVRTERSLVAGPVSLDVLRARLADVELGQDQVAAVLGRWVPAVVIVSATAEQSGRLLGAAVAPSLSAGPGQAVSDGQLAATTHGDRAPASPALADRVILDPVGLAQLTAAGRRVVLTHELTHVAVRASTLHDVPLWLSEGFAEWVAFRAERLDPRVVAARLLDRVRRSGAPTSLPSPADFAGATGDPATAYQASWLAAARIAADAGESGLVRIVHLMGGVVGEVPSSAPPVALDRALRIVLVSPTAARVRATPVVQTAITY